MARFFTWKAAATLVGAIFIGALGNAAWEYLLKPLLPWVSDLIIDVATLGIQSYRDEIYREVAKGNDERAAIATFALVSSVPLAIFLSTVSAVGLRTRRKAIISRLVGEDTDSSARIDRAHRIIVVGLVVMGMASTFFIISLVRTIYVVRASAHLDQFQRIVAPYVTPEQRLTLASRVAQMTTEAQYRDIVRDMSEVASQKKLTIPDFDLR